MAITTPTPITPSPPLPQRSDPATFENRADAYYQWQSEDLPDGIDAQSEAAYQNALESSLSATAADQRATDAETAKGLAEDARDKAEEWAEGVEPAPGSKSAKGWAEESEVYRDAAVVAAAAAGSAAGLPSMEGQEGKALMVQPGVGGGPPVPGWGIPSLADYQEFTTSGTWTKHEGINFVALHIVGGGGGGSGQSGGCGGQGIFMIFPASEFDATESVVVGSGGAPSVSGGDSSFGGIVALGGRQGNNNNFNFLYGLASASAAASSMIENSRGEFTGFGSLSAGGMSTYGGGGGSASTTPGQSGKSVFAGNGGTGGTNGSFPGGGGGGNGGSGASGVVRVWSW